MSVDVVGFDVVVDGTVVAGDLHDGIVVVQHQFSLALAFHEQLGMERAFRG